MYSITRNSSSPCRSRSIALGRVAAADAGQGLAFLLDGGAAGVVSLQHDQPVEARVAGQVGRALTAVTEALQDLVPQPPGQGAGRRRRRGSGIGVEEGGQVVMEPIESGRPHCAAEMVEERVGGELGDPSAAVRAGLQMLADRIRGPFVELAQAEGVEDLVSRMALGASPIRSVSQASGRRR